VSRAAGGGWADGCRQPKYGDTICRWFCSARPDQLSQTMSGTAFSMVSPHFARPGGFAAAYRPGSTSIALRQHCTVPPKTPQSGRAWEPGVRDSPGDNTREIVGHHRGLSDPFVHGVPEFPATGSVWEPTPTPEPSSVGPTIINVIGVSISDCLHLSGE
jgi:hypothetical protein